MLPRPTLYANGHPIDDQEALADWMGYDSEEEMDEEHDAVHEVLCDALNITSFSLAMRDGEDLTEQQEFLAVLEEAAVMHVQRLLQFHRKL